MLFYSPSTREPSTKDHLYEMVFPSTLNLLIVCNQPVQFSCFIHAVTFFNLLTIYSQVRSLPVGIILTLQFCSLAILLEPSSAESRMSIGLLVWKKLGTKNCATQPVVVWTLGKEEGSFFVIFVVNRNAQGSLSKVQKNRERFIIIFNLKNICCCFKQKEEFVHFGWTARDCQYALDYRGV